MLRLANARGLTAVTLHSILRLTAAGQSQPDADTVTVSVLMTTDTANDHGEVCSVALVAISNRVASICAERFAWSEVSTEQLHAVRSHEAVHVGELVTFFAAAASVDATHVRVDVRVVFQPASAGVRIEGRDDDPWTRLRGAW
jgi:acyl-CoA hydrolase